MSVEQKMALLRIGMWILAFAVVSTALALS